MLGTSLGGEMFFVFWGVLWKPNSQSPDITLSLDNLLEVFHPGGFSSWLVCGGVEIFVGWWRNFLGHKPGEFGEIGKVSVIATGPFNKTRVLGTCALHACCTPFL